MIICYSTFAPDRISAITKKKLLTAAIIRVMHLIVEEDISFIAGLTATIVLVG